jgi:hypothetical protein
MMRVGFYTKVSGLKYRGLHRIFCRIRSVAFFVEFTFLQIFHKRMFVRFTSVGNKFSLPLFLTSRSLHPTEVSLTISHCVHIFGLVGKTLTHKWVQAYYLTYKTMAYAGLKKTSSKLFSFGHYGARS